MILGIDPSTACTGFCIMNYDGSIQNKGSITPDKHSDDGNRIVDIVSQLYFICEQWDIRDIICEDQFGGKGFASGAKLIALRGAIQYALNGFAVVKLVFPSSWRAKIGLNRVEWAKKLGIEPKGKKYPPNLWKSISVAYVNQEYGLDLVKKDNDIADAICIAKYYTLVLKDEISKDQ